jgi:signal transduction histidine kinase
MMGGQIYAESEEDRGSSFIFTIPLYQDHEKQNMKQFS